MLTTDYTDYTDYYALVLSLSNVLVLSLSNANKNQRKPLLQGLRACPLRATLVLSCLRASSRTDHQTITVSMRLRPCFRKNHRPTG